ncbi:MULTISPECIES: hypothetical protein [unclassified Marinobacterium]|uniref:hypothetical protein n=1 Tax=unclassified Marinobacterium TaxID=2644139 RepID=UPI001568535D|nr:MULTISPECIES: hypothetical protein [unclassified Marinobacterium]NRP09353.1 hypothetical protein [Marinobacterium sp. xm-g-48]NRP82116.1 hypothetical protein [Marinobacterium sp. xm-d-509]
MFNSSDSVVFIKNGEELYSAILDSITIARNIVARAYGKNVLSADEGGSRKYPSATIFRFLDGYTSRENRVLFNEDWVINVLSLVTNGVQGYGSVYAICTELGRSRKLNNGLTKYCKADALLLLHLLWVGKAILLPVNVSMPTRNSNIGKELYACSDLMPELLGIFLGENEKYPLESIVDARSIKNTLWYAYRVIRASDWYSVSDIEQADFVTATNFTYSHPGYPFTLRQWLLGLGNVVSDLPYDLAKIPVGKLGGQVQILTEEGEIDLNADHGLGEEGNSKINQWNQYIHKFGQAKKAQGAKSWKDFVKIPSVIVGWLINEVASVDQAKIPAISEFKRIHLDGFDGVKGLLEYVRGDNSPKSYQSNLYKIDKFFDYLSMHDEFNFRNQINRDIDFPLVKRSNSTSKVIFDGDLFAPLLSFAYALADWGWYLFEKSKDDGLAGVYYNNLKVVDNESVGFIPIFWVDGKPYPIKFLTPKMAPMANRQFKGVSTTRNVPDLHYVNLFTVLCETGIRGMSARWLDVRNYRKSVNPRTYRERDYGITKLHVNTDKVGHSWDSTVVNTVIEILDRQAEFRNAMDEECLTVESWYDGHEQSPFGKILPLFALGGVSRGAVNGHSPITDASMRAAHKMFIYLFQAYYFEATGEKIMELDYDPTDVEEFSVSTDYGFENILKAYNRDLIKITPHSARSQVVSQYITILPPSEVMKITGHTTEAHLVYYAQLDRMVLDKAKEKQFEEIVRELSDPASITAQAENSALRESFRKNRDAMLSDFGATSFTTNENNSTSEAIDAVELIKTKNVDEVAFNTTHICPFNNICPETLLKQFNTDEASKPCGGCYYSVKTVDHIPAILAKIRAFTDESSEIQQYLKESKASGADANALSSYVKRRRFLSDEIIAWTVTFQCLEQMANVLAERDDWLVQKPEMLSKELTKMEIKNPQYQGLLVKASEAKSYAEFFTPTLEHQITKARTKLLAHTGNFKALMDETPNGFALIDQYRGLVNSICSTLGIGVTDLAEKLEQPIALPEPSNSPLLLLSTAGGGNHA